MKISINFFTLFIFFICVCLVVSGSLWQAQYTYDPHHWGLMFGNAKDVYEGKLPYKEVFIQYGILTTLIHSCIFYFGH